jgi:GDP-4-dehydro-6-deoxy-D-mannose reductase
MLNGAAVIRALEASPPDVVYHCAGAPHVGRAWKDVVPTFETNVRGTHHLIEALRDVRPGARVLIPSSGMVYAPSSQPLSEEDLVQPGGPYALSKLAQELLGAANPRGPAVLIARPFNHFGPRQTPTFAASEFARTIVAVERGEAEPELRVGNLDTRRDLTDVRDTVRAYQLIAERGAPGRVYNVCSGRAVLVRDLLDRLLARSSASIRVVTDPDRYRPNDLPTVVGSPRRIHEELGWSADIPLDRTLDDILTYWRETSGRPHEC